MIKSILLAAGVALAATPSAGTEWVYCNDADSVVTVGLLLGSVDVLAVAGIILSHNDKVWASAAAYGPGDAISLGQGFADDRTLWVDLKDADYATVAELRLVKASEGDSSVTAGTLHLPGRGAWAVSCEGP